MRAVLSGEQRVKRKYAGVGSFPKRQWRQRMGAPSQGADNMAEVLHCREGGIQRRASYGVDDEVEPLAMRAGFDILLDRLLAVVDRSRAQTGDEFLIALTGRRPDHSAQRARQLHGNMTHPAGSALDQHSLASPEMRAIHDSQNTR